MRTGPSRFLCSEDDGCRRPQDAARNSPKRTGRTIGTPFVKCPTGSVERTGCRVIPGISQRTNLRRRCRLHFRANITTSSSSISASRKPKSTPAPEQRCFFSGGPLPSAQSPQRQAIPCYSSEFTDEYRAARANGNCRPLFLRGFGECTGGVLPSSSTRKWSEAPGDEHTLGRSLS
jgi:hypothetical protein